MNADTAPAIIDATPDTIGEFGLCGFKDPKRPGYRQKLEWLRQRFEEGLRIKILHSSADGTLGSIEYLPGEYAWRGVRASGYMMIHCLFIMKKACKGKGYGSQLIAACEAAARDRKMHGVAVVTSSGTWMAGQEIFLKNGYVRADEAPPHFQLLVRRFSDGRPLPAFSGDWEAKLAHHPAGLTIMHSDQCPYVAKAIAEIPAAARDEFGIEPTIVELSSCHSAQDSPNPYGVFSVIWNGELVADHAISRTRFMNIMKKAVQCKGATG